MVHEDVNLKHSARGLCVAIVVSRYHRAITDALRAGAAAAFTDAGGNEDDLVIVDAPGAFELPVLCGALAQQRTGGQAVDGIVALGCVITGETTHDTYINSAVSTALAQLSVETGVPIGFGVLTCATMEQAQARSGGDKGNKGTEAMHAVIDAACTIQTLLAGKELG